MNVPQTGQPFDPLEFMAVAQDLAVRGGEANLRAAIGRLYYALFLLAREKSRIVTEFDVHREVIRVTTQWNQAAGERLRELSRLRKMSDYELMPQRQADQNWSINWQKAQKISKELLPGLQRLVQY